MLANVSADFCRYTFQISYLLIPSTELEKTLDSDDIEDIIKAVTPKTLSKCKSNTLLKGIEVNAQYKFSFVL